EGFGGAGHPRAVLGEQPPPGPGQPTGRARQHTHAPACWTVPTSSRRAAAARSAKRSSLKPPAASCSPNSSPASTAPATWVNKLPPVVVNPPAEPGSPLTAPASATVPTSATEAA